MNLKDRVDRLCFADIEESYRIAGLTDLKVKGMQAMARCPFHDDRKPSLSINLQNGLWKCFAGCGQGNIYHFFGKILGIDTQKKFHDLIVEMEAMYVYKKR